MLGYFLLKIDFQCPWHPGIRCSVELRTISIRILRSKCCNSLPRGLNILKFNHRFGGFVQSAETSVEYASAVPRCQSSERPTHLPPPHHTISLIPPIALPPLLVMLRLPFPTGTQPIVLVASDPVQSG